eukprot:scaffold9094_cov153-Skeletonema_marinoi.AAC.1
MTSEPASSVVDNDDVGDSIDLLGSNDGNSGSNAGMANAQELTARVIATRLHLLHPNLGRLLREEVLHSAIWRI